MEEMIQMILCENKNEIPKVFIDDHNWIFQTFEFSFYRKYFYLSTELHIFNVQSFELRSPKVHSWTAKIVLDFQINF